MINTLELRVGNYVLYNGQPIMVNGITYNTVMLDGILLATENPNNPYEYKHINANDESIKPIPLCDLILETIRQRIPLKNGFVYSYNKKSSTYFIYKDDEKGFFIGVDFRGELIRVTPKPFRYLHQLQNVFFAQYGNEMIIDEQMLKNSVEKAVENGVI